MDSAKKGFSALSAEYRRRIRLCRQLEDKKAFLRQRIVQLRGTHDPAARTVVPLLHTNLRQLDDRLFKEQCRAAEEALLLDRAIAKLQNERLAQILRCHHLELMPWNEVSELTGLGVRWLNRLNNRALSQLD